VLLVTRIDPLGAVAEPEVAAALEARGPLDFGPAQLLGDAGIDSAFVDDRRPALGIDPSGRLAWSTGVGTVTM
jgi:hypothetical protein